jgi:predicted DNA-binding transcriptional regulator AlpA
MKSLRLANVNQVARFCGVSHGTAEKWVMYADFPSRSAAGWDRAEVRQFEVRRRPELAELYGMEAPVDGFDYLAIEPGKGPPGDGLGGVPLR